MAEDGDSTLLWQRRLAELVTWYNAHGNCNVPKAEGKLGRWVVRQRELQKKGKLEPVRKTVLDELSFVWNTNEAAWESRYVLLCEYAKDKGNCCVPISHPVLGMWVAKMRANRRRQKLPEHREKKLNDLGFVWNTAEADWMNKYKNLLEFQQREGHACVPFNLGELGWWVNTQRQSKRKGKLSKQRNDLLNKAGFIWNPQEFLAMRRRAAQSARARPATSPSITSSEPIKLSVRPAVLNENEKSSRSPAFEAPARKRAKTSNSIPVTPLQQTPLLTVFTDSVATNGSDHTRDTGHKSPCPELRIEIPFSHVSLRQLVLEPKSTTSSVQSMSSTMMVRADLGSLASVLSPASGSSATRLQTQQPSIAPLRGIPHSSSATPLQTQQPYIAPLLCFSHSSKVPDFHSDSRMAICIARARRARVQQRSFVLPPVSSLMKHANNSRF